VFDYEYDELHYRRKHIRWLGYVLLFAFFCPIVIPASGPHPAETRYINMSLLFEKDVPGIVILLCLWPLLAGLATLALAYAKNSTLRGFGLMLLFIIPLEILITNPDSIQAAAPISSVVGYGQEISIVLGLIAVPCVFAGSRARWFRPHSHQARWVAVVGALLVIATFLIPTPMFPSRLAPRPKNVAPVGVPFELLQHYETFLPGIFLLAALLFAVATCYFCLVNAPSRLLEENRKLASLAFISLIATWLSNLAAGFAAAFTLAPEGLTTERLNAFLLVALKVLAWGGGLFLLLPIGLTDYLVCRSPFRPNREIAPPYGYLASSPPPPDLAPDDVASDTEAKLRVLKELLDAGSISPEKYEAKKAELLKRL